MSSCNCGANPCSCGGIIESLKGCIDSVLSTRDCIGANLYPVFIIQRTWSGERPGDGLVEEVIEQVLPTPEVKDFSHDVRLTQGGAVKQGDLILKNISKNKYPKEADVDCSTDLGTVEKFYLINDRYYTVINVKENYVTWDVQIRKRSEERVNGEG